MLSRGNPESGFLRSHGQFASLGQLRLDCLTQTQVASGITLVPGKDMETMASNKLFYWRINGKYGLQLRTPPSAGNLLLAQMGFNLVGNTVVITHSPQ